MTVRIIQGDCLAVLPTLEAESVHMVCTSPPYWGLRNYNVDGQLGLEPTYQEHIAALVKVFREIWRVLRNDGTVWLNYGDCYAGSVNGRSAADTKAAGNDDRAFRDKPFSTVGGTLKPKDLAMLPARLAIALQDDGWWIRSDIIWHKPNPMPESIQDRPTSSYEHVFLLAKSGSTTFWVHRNKTGSRTSPPPDYRWIDSDGDDAETDSEPASWKTERSAKDSSTKRWRRINLWRGQDYFYDSDAIREGCAVPDWENGTRVYGGVNKSVALAESGIRRVGRTAGKRGVPPRHEQYASSDQSGLDDVGRGGGRTARNVWTIATTPYSEAHFATFPPALAERCISAGTSQRGCCPACAAPWVRTITKGEPDEAHKAACGADASGGYAGHSTKDHAAHGVQDASAVKARILDGLRERISSWQPSCDCPAADPVPCTVLDPFAGAFTTAMVADRMQRNCIGIELNPDYVAMARKRLTKDAGIFADLT